MLCYIQITAINRKQNEKFIDETFICYYVIVTATFHDLYDYLRQSEKLRYPIVRNEEPDSCQIQYKI